MAKKTGTKAKVTKAKPSGMWKILELKQAQQKLREQTRSLKNSQNGTLQKFESYMPDPRFTKFAGPRRKVG